MTGDRHNHLSLCLFTIYGFCHAPTWMLFHISFHIVIHLESISVCIQYIKGCHWQCPCVSIHCTKQFTKTRLYSLHCFNSFLLVFFFWMCPPVCAVYTGIAPGHSQEIGVCIALLGMGLGFCIQFVLSVCISAEANLNVLLTVSVGALYMFVIADNHFGSGNYRRTCCRRKHDERTVNGQIEERTESNGKNTLHYMRTCLHI